MKLDRNYSMMNPDTDGKFVKFDDAEELIAEKDALLLKALQIIKFGNSRDAAVQLADEIMQHGIELPKHKAEFIHSPTAFHLYEVFELRNDKYSFVDTHSGIDEQAAINQYLLEKKSRKSI